MLLQTSVDECFDESDLSSNSVDTGATHQSPEAISSADTVSRNSVACCDGSQILTTPESEDEELLSKFTYLRYSTCLQSSSPQYCATELAVAPVEGQIPRDICSSQTLNTWRFPQNFLKDEEVCQLIAQFQSRFRSTSFSAFPVRTEYLHGLHSFIFFAQYVTQMNQIGYKIIIASGQTADKLSMLQHCEGWCSVIVRTIYYKTFVAVPLTFTEQRESTLQRFPV